MVCPRGWKVVEPPTEMNTGGPSIETGSSTTNDTIIQGCEFIIISYIFDIIFISLGIAKQKLIRFFMQKKSLAYL